MRRPSSNSTTLLSRTAPSWVSVIWKISPTPCTRCPGAAAARLSLPSHSGCLLGSAMNSKMAAAGAAMVRVAVTILSSAGCVIPPSWQGQRRRLQERTDRLDDAGGLSSYATGHYVGMKAKQVYENDGLRTFVVVMDKDDEAFGQLGAFAAEQKVSAAGLTAV